MSPQRVLTDHERALADRFGICIGCGGPLCCLWNGAECW